MDPQYAAVLKQGELSQLRYRYTCLPMNQKQEIHVSHTPGTVSRWHPVPVNDVYVEIRSMQSIQCLHSGSVETG